jgi:photosystem II stability/assembly factor-like uncharacterized protein
MLFIKRFKRPIVVVLASALIGILVPTAAANAVPIPPFTVASMSCVSGSHCVAVGTSGGRGAIAVTFDGGTSWARQVAPSGSTSLSGVSCFGDLACSAVGTATVTTAPFIISTSNGGASWLRQPVMTPPPGITVGSLLGISCTSTTSCGAVGDSTAGIGVILRKTMASSLWTFTASFGSSLESVSCAGTVNCYASGSVASGSDFSALVVATHNSGQTWSEAFHFPAVAAGSGTDSELSSIACVQAQCEAVGITNGMGSVPIAFSSIDNGHTWTTLHLPAGFTPKSVRCVSMTSCFMAGGSRIMFTANNGRNWTAQSVPTGITDLTGIKCASQLACTSFGANDLIATFDGGHTWQQRTYP